MVLQRDDNIFNCPENNTEESIDYRSSNFIIGVFSILNGLAFFYYIPCFLVFSLCYVNISDQEAANAACGKIGGGVAILLGFLSSLTDVVVTGLQENCRTTEADLFLLFNFVLTLFVAFAALQVAVVFFWVFVKGILDDD